MLCLPKFVAVSHQFFQRLRTLCGSTRNCGDLVSCADVDLHWRLGDLRDTKLKLLLSSGINLAQKTWEVGFCHKTFLECRLNSFFFTRCCRFLSPEHSLHRRMNHFCPLVFRQNTVWSSKTIHKMCCPCSLTSRSLHLFGGVPLLVGEWGRFQPTELSVLFSFCKKKFRMTCFFPSILCSSASTACWNELSWEEDQGQRKWHCSPKTKTKKTSYLSSWAGCFTICSWCFRFSNTQDVGRVGYKTILTSLLRHCNTAILHILCDHWRGGHWLIHSLFWTERVSTRFSISHLS